MATILSSTSVAVHHEQSQSPNGSSSTLPNHVHGSLKKTVAVPELGDLASSPPSPLTNSADDARFDVVNVCCTFRTHCHLDLRKIAMNAANVELRRDPPSVRMKLRHPPVTASIWSAGKVMVVGAKSEVEALLGARRVARKIQKCGFNLRFMDYKVVNTLSCVYLPFGVRIDKLKDAYPREIEYEPELHPSARFSLPEVNGQLQISQTGNMTITAPNVKNAQLTFRAVYPKLVEFRKAKEAVSQSELRKSSNKRKALAKSKLNDAKRWKIDADVEAFNLMEEEEDDDENVSDVD